jgi:hypothetical protein
MRYDSGRHEVVRFDFPSPEDWHIDDDGQVVRVNYPRDHKYPIVRERVRNLAWAVAAMVSEPGAEYSSMDGSRWRFNADKTWFETFEHGQWLHEGYCFSYTERDSTSWHRLPAEVEEGSRAWAEAQIKDGWIVRCPKCSPATYAIINGELSRSDDDDNSWGRHSKLCDCELHAAGWERVRRHAEVQPGGHEWLRSLPDGTEVETRPDAHFYYVKQGGSLRCVNSDGEPVYDRAYPIGEYANGGWRLRTKPAPVTVSLSASASTAFADIASLLRSAADKLAALEAKC